MKRLEKALIAKRNAEEYIQQIEAKAEEAGFTPVVTRFMGDSSVGGSMETPVNRLMHRTENYHGDMNSMDIFIIADHSMAFRHHP